ncbi:MAG TPA: SAM-dependent chlorinase/fluorinase, partial [Deltaproteobacteria bacterium]|nr:SAM-dependent chlorinase/fluorinase [Deltaproteobacteria bacterium]
MIPLLTFLSDFGSRDAYAAQVKAVILSKVPEAKIVDISHEVEPFNLVSAGWLLFTSYRYFPAGTVHLAVVDPGVGTARAVLLVRKGGHVFVGPDNGLFSFLYPADEVV